MHSKFVEVVPTKHEYGVCIDVLFCTPHTLHLTPYTSLLTPYTLHLTPHTSLLTPYTSLLTPHTLHLTPYTLHLTPHSLHLTPQSHLFGSHHLQATMLCTPQQHHSSSLVIRALPPVVLATATLVCYLLLRTRLVSDINR